jgi:hypothetical protein
MHSKGMGSIPGILGGAEANIENLSEGSRCSEGDSNLKLTEHKAGSNIFLGKASLVITQGI